MLDTLEELEPKFKRVWQKQVPMEELTVLAVHPNPGQALVLTNRGLYLLSKRFWKVAVRRWPKDHLTEIRSTGRRLLFQAGEKQLEVEFSPEKKGIIPLVLKKIEQNINPG